MHRRYGACAAEGKDRSGRRSGPGGTRSSMRGAAVSQPSSSRSRDARSDASLRRACRRGEVDRERSAADRTARAATPAIGGCGPLAGDDRDGRALARRGASAGPTARRASRACRRSSWPATSDRARSQVVNEVPIGGRGSSTRSAANAASGTAPAPARRCAAGTAASSGSSRSASMRTPGGARRRASRARPPRRARARPPAQQLRRQVLVEPHPRPPSASASRRAGVRLSGPWPIATPRLRRPGAARVVDGEVDLGDRAPGARRAARRPPAVSSTRRVVRTNRTTPRSRSSSRIARESGDCDMCSRSAARPKCSSSATATK